MFCFFFNVDPLKFGKKGGLVVETLSEKRRTIQPLNLYAQTFSPPLQCKSTDWSESMMALLHHSLH